MKEQISTLKTKRIVYENPRSELVLEFIEPIPRLIAFAEQSLESSNHQLRAVAKCLINLFEVSKDLEVKLESGEPAELHHYLDFWLGDAADIAKGFLDSQITNENQLAQCLIGMENAMIRSKESALGNIKARGLQRADDE